MERRIPLIHAQYEAYLNGGSMLVGLVDVTMPNFQALSETVRGAGLMGEMNVAVRGQLQASTTTLNFRALYGSINGVGVSETHRFDLRSAIESEDRTSYERVFGSERLSIVGIVASIDLGTRAVASPANASIVIDNRRIEHFIDGRQVLEFDPLNYIYKVNGRDIYAAVMAALR